MRARSRSRRLALLGAGVALAAMSSQPAAATAAPKKRPPSDGLATVTSVDGPGRLTLTTKGGRLKVRLFLVDTPEPGECGAAESTAALKRLTSGRAKRVRYVVWSGTADAEGRREASVGPRGADLTERSLGHQLVASEWARVGGARLISASDGIVYQAANEIWGPRTPRGVWARCGGRMHLPAGEPVPAHAPASWTINADGVAEAVGPLKLSPTLAPGSTLTVGDVERLAPIETTDMGQGTCHARVPSLELMLVASAPPRTPCRAADVSMILSSGPGAVTTNRGLRTGHRAADARTRFPRLDATMPSGAEGSLPLAGYDTLPWAWQTVAGVDERTGKINLFATSTAPFPQ